MEVCEVQIHPDILENYNPVMHERVRCSFCSSDFLLFHLFVSFQCQMWLNFKNIPPTALTCKTTMSGVHSRETLAFKWTKGNKGILMYHTGGPLQSIIILYYKGAWPWTTAEPAAVCEEMEDRESEGITSINITYMTISYYYYLYFL